MVKIKKEERSLLREIESLINERTINYSDVEYRRFLARVLKKLYAIRNLDYVKKGVISDFNNENNPSKQRIKRRYNKIKPKRETSFITKS